MTEAVTRSAQDQSASYLELQTTSIAGELAVLLVENESTQQSAAREELRAARQAYLADAARQASELHDAADAMATGALIGAAFTVAGGACTIEAAQQPFNSASSKTWAAVGDSLSHLAKPASDLVQSTAENDRADAKEAETQAQTEQWIASDAQAEIDANNRRTDKILELTSSISQEQSAAQNAIIGRI